MHYFFWFAGAFLFAAFLGSTCALQNVEPPLAWTPTLQRLLLASCVTRCLVWFFPPFVLDGSSVGVLVLQSPSCRIVLFLRVFLSFSESLLLEDFLSFVALISLQFSFTYRSKLDQWSNSKKRDSVTFLIRLTLWPKCQL